MVTLISHFAGVVGGGLGNGRRGRHRSLCQPRLVHLRLRRRVGGRRVDLGRGEAGRGETSLLVQTLIGGEFHVAADRSANATHVQEEQHTGDAAERLEEGNRARKVYVDL